MAPSWVKRHFLLTLAPFWKVHEKTLPLYLKKEIILFTFSFSVWLDVWLTERESTKDSKRGLYLAIVRGRPSVPRAAGRRNPPSQGRWGPAWAWRARRGSRSRGRSSWRRWRPDRSSPPPWPAWRGPCRRRIRRRRPPQERPRPTSASGSRRPCTPGGQSRCCSRSQPLSGERERERERKSGRTP